MELLFKNVVPINYLFLIDTGYPGPPGDKVRFQNHIKNVFSKPKKYSTLYYNNITISFRESLEWMADW
jgi:hypothetical protein